MQLVRGDSIVRIAASFGLGRKSVERHRDNHLPSNLAYSPSAQEIAKADSLLDQIKDLQTKTLTILSLAKQAGDLRTAIQAINAARANLELLAKLTAQLDERPQINLAVNPEWVHLRTAILLALEPHPDAMEAVRNAIQ